MNRTFKKLSRCRSDGMNDATHLNNITHNTSRYNNKYQSRNEFTNNNNPHTHTHNLKTQSSVYQNDFTFPKFSNFSKFQLNNPITHNSKMLCTDCFNKNLIIDHELTNKYIKHNSSMDYPHNTTLLDNMRDTNQKLIQDRINTRETQAINTYKALNQNKNNKKELLQNGNENENFFRNNKDYNKERAKQREIVNENFVKNNKDKFKDSHSKVSQYYDKYVGKGNKSILPQEASRYISKEEYYAQVKQQMEMKRKQKEKELQKEKVENDLYRIENDKQNKKYQQQYLDRLKYQYQILNDNKRLIEEKAMKNKKEKIRKLKEEDELLKKDQAEKAQLLYEEEKRRELCNEITNNNLNRFLHEKEQKRIELENEKQMDKCFKGLCLHGCSMGKCDNCCRSVPKRSLTPFIEKKGRGLHY